MPPTAGRPQPAISIPSDDYCRRLAEVEAVIDAQRDRVNLLIDIGVSRIEAAQGISERHPVLAEIVEIVLDPRRALSQNAHSIPAPAVQPRRVSAPWKSNGNGPVPTGPKPLQVLGRESDSGRG